MTETGLRPLSFLLVSEGPTTSWVELLQQAVSTLGELEMVAEKDAVEAVAETRWDLVVVDAGAVREFASLVSSLRSGRPDLRVAVFTSSPTWRRTRDVLQAGAVDYVRKSLSMDETRSTLETLLALPLPKA